jgi:hypothetical protein
LLAEGKSREALVAAAEALATRAEMGVRSLYQPLEIALEAAFALSDKAKMDELLAIVEELPPGELTPALRSLGARFAARRAALDGDAETANAGMVAATAILREMELPFHLGVVLLEHAELLAAEGRQDDAEPLLSEARTIFERLRATPWLERLDRVVAPAPRSAVEVGDPRGSISVD